MTGHLATVDGRSIETRGHQTILRAAASAGIRIPTLCYSSDVAPEGGCRICIVEVEGSPRPVAACHTPIVDGMAIRTTTPALESLRKGILELILSEHAPGDFNPNAEGSRFEALLDQFGVAAGPLSARFGNAHQLRVTDNSSIAAAGANLIDATHTYMRFDRSLCITCRQCLSVCEQVQGQFVYGIEGRGGRSRLIFGSTELFADSPCVSCGACVDHCPTGAISDRDRRPYVPATKTVDTTCGYCGVGCQMRVETSERRILRIDGVTDAAVNHGHLCVKGRYAHAYQHSNERLTSPLLRESGKLRPLSWPEATDWVSRRLIEQRERHGPNSLGVLTSARATNESVYLLQKLFRTAIGTNNVDCCARVCHSSTALALHRMTGSSAGTASFDDIERARCIVVAGSNATEAHPVVGARIKQAALRGVPLIVIDPRQIELTEYARLHLSVRPGANVPLFNAIAKVLIDEQLIDGGYLAAHCEGFEELADFLARHTIEELLKPTGVLARQVHAAARLVGESRPVLIVHGIGLSELTQGTDSVMSLINLGMLTGSIGRPGSGMLPLRGQNNVQGNVDMGASPTRLTGDQRLDDPRARLRSAEIWGKPPPEKPGLMATQMIEAAEQGVIRGLWVQGFDLAQSMNNEKRTRAALSKLDLLIVQDIFWCELCEYAHVVLPAAAGLEQDGTFTNAERRIQLVRPAVPPPGLALPEWQVVRDIARSLGETWHYESAADVMDEIARVAPETFGGVSHERLAGGGLQWPCPALDHPGTATVHENGFVRGRGRLKALEYIPSPEQTDETYPYVLITGRRLEHFNVGTMTRRSPNLELVPGDLLEMHPDDARREGILDNGEAEIVSRWGTVRVAVRSSDRVSPGMLFLTFHYPQTHANQLTSPHLDPDSKCPEYKITAVSVRAAP